MSDPAFVPFTCIVCGESITTRADIHAPCNKSPLPEAREIARLRAALKAIEQTTATERNIWPSTAIVDAVYTMAVDALAGADYFTKET